MYKNNYLASRIAAHLVAQPSATFLSLFPTGEKISYSAFFQNAEKLAAALVAAGVKPGDRVAVQAPKTVAMLELYVATLLSGAVFLPLNTAYMATEVAYFLGDAEPRIFVCDPARLDALAPVAKGCGVGEVWTLGADETGSLVDRRDAEATGFDAVARDEKDLAAILYTSGTTGRSKGAMLSHLALASNSQTLTEIWRFTRDDVLIHALPIFHTHGLFVATNVTLMAGCSAIFMRGFDADDVLKVMPDATALMGVPTFYTRLLERPSLGDGARHMRLFISGSAPLLAETHWRWHEKTGHVILERYGMTETSMNTSNPYEGERRAGTVGFPLPGVELKVTDPETGADVAPGGVGMVEVRGPNLFSGYWRMPEKTAEELRANGFLITGDIGQIDRDGYLSIVGRAKDLIITGGLNVYPKEVELVIDALSNVAESAVIGVPHADLGEAVVAVVVLNAGAEMTRDEVVEGTSAALARFKRPRDVIFVPELPRNTMGKVQKNVLREQFS